MIKYAKYLAILPLLVLSHGGFGRIYRRGCKKFILSL